MGEQQSILVPRVSSFPGHEARARAIVRWLVQRRIVEERLTPCGRTAGGLAHALAPGARLVVEQPQLLPFGQTINGLEIVTKRCIYTPTRDFLEEAGCPQCRREIGEALFDSLEEWMPGHTDNFSCPECGHEDDINGFLFLQPCGFSNLGFIFNGWGAAGFRQDFLDEFAERLGFPLSRVSVDP
ncbi:sugar ABC transporter ATPase [Pseudomonas benzenivorans]|uniref:Sugar ABC transporter ATPase n=1 Tax=Pseudomonas benzenivorans TaxID=556533 RepID=A0ABY5HD91_9PSED|nr:sugar ABC transporter ATPase [Pseudomonas benzenivorans]UTW08961.1 sugar ABC transporter ATPase [Pseudomonas benzenivorans]